MEEQGFIRYLSLFFTSWLKEHGQLLEQANLTEPLMQSLGYLIMMSNIPDKEVFKICLEYWSTLASSLFNEQYVLVALDQHLLLTGVC
jgi:exportin-1